MSNYSLTVCLSDLQGAQLQVNQQGQQFLTISVQAADLFVSDKGKVYLNLSMWAKKNGADQYGKTHGIKQSLSQAMQQAMGDAARNIPFIGHAKPITPKGQQQGYSQVQNQPVYQQQPPMGYQQPIGYPQSPGFGQPSAPQQYSQQSQTEDLPF